jgi:RimJ/RimL family protein N-acetyltransferase
VIETERLRLRPFTISDTDAAFGWFGDPEVMRFIAGGADRTGEDTRRRVDRYIEHQCRHGFSKWLVIEKATGTTIGDSGLVILEELGPAPDLGFRFHKSHWRRGYATEVARAWCRAAFADLGVPRLSAFAHVDNIASRHVLEKVGFVRQRRAMVMGMDCHTYALEPSLSSNYPITRLPGHQTPAMASMNVDVLIKVLAAASAGLLSCGGSCR